MTDELHVWKIEDSETHWIIATDEADARSVYATMLDLDDEDDYLAVGTVAINVLPDTQLLEIDNAGIDDSAVRKTCGEWVKEGRGLLCSTCW